MIYKELFIKINFVLFVISLSFFIVLGFLISGISDTFESHLSVLLGFILGMDLMFLIFTFSVILKYVEINRGRDKDNGGL